MKLYYASALITAFLLMLQGAFSTISAEERIENIYFSVKCSTSGQVCLPPGHVVLNLDSPATVSMSFNTPSSHCSKVMVEISGPLTGTSDWLESSQSTGTLDTKSLDAGIYDFLIYGTGTPGGCNEGSLKTWAGFLNFSINKDYIQIEKNMGNPTCSTP